MGIPTKGQGRKEVKGRESKTKEGSHGDSLPKGALHPAGGTETGLGVDSASDLQQESPDCWEMDLSLQRGCAAQGRRLQSA